MNDARFWSRVDKSGECWLWMGGKGNGYGRLGRMVDGKLRFYSAHRYAYEQKHGLIPAGLVVMHRCDVRECVRPEHLTLGTLAENCADTGRKGRARNQHTGKLRPTPRPSPETFAWCAGGAK